MIQNGTESFSRHIVSCSLMFSEKFDLQKKIKTDRIAANKNAAVTGKIQNQWQGFVISEFDIMFFLQSYSLIQLYSRYVFFKYVAAFELSDKSDSDKDVLVPESFL